MLSCHYSRKRKYKHSQSVEAGSIPSRKIYIRRLAHHWTLRTLKVLVTWPLFIIACRKPVPVWYIKLWKRLFSQLFLTSFSKSIRLAQVDNTNCHTHTCHYTYLVLLGGWQYDLTLNTQIRIHGYVINFEEKNESKIILEKNNFL